MSINDVLILLSVSYYFGGYDMVMAHTSSHPVDQPAYVRRGFLRKFFVGAFWPFVAMINNEFSWFFLIFVSSTTILFSGYYFLHMFMTSSVLIVLILSFLRITPFLMIPNSIFATLLWLIFAKPLGLKVPGWVERMNM